MHIRSLRTAILCLSIVSSVVACTRTPTAPTVAPSVAATPVGGSSAVESSHPSTASPARFGNRTPGVVFVTSQGLYYDTFVVKDPLPMQGRFQLISNGETQFGPGQDGYLGGRWWEDLNDDGIQDADDHYFLCPLLPPGRPTP